MEADRGSSGLGVSSARVLPVEEHSRREENRQGLAELDRMTEQSSRLTRRQKDANRVFPREGTKRVNPRKRREFLHRDEVRLPVSRRQRRERSKVLLATQQRMTRAQARDLREIAAGGRLWHRLNDQLSDNTGDIDAFSDRDRARVRRLDRAIRQYEEVNDRNHVVYSALDLPEGFTASDLKAGDTLGFDRFTVARHNIHEVPGDSSSTCVVEISTPRGMYLAVPGDRHTAHMLPRGMRFTVGETYDAHWRDANGNEGVRSVVRLHVVEEDRDA